MWQQALAKVSAWTDLEHRRDRLGLRFPEALRLEEHGVGCLCFGCRHQPARYYSNTYLAKWRVLVAGLSGARFALDRRVRPDQKNYVKCRCRAMIPATMRTAFAPSLAGSRCISISSA